MRIPALLAMLLASSMVLAETEAPAIPSDDAQPASAEESAVSYPALPPDMLRYQTGQIELPSGVATLSLAAGDRYLDPQETSKLLVLWGNPPHEHTEGAIVPAGVDPLGASGWAVILTYEADGHVSDEDAEDVDYGELLAQMQEFTNEANGARAQEGYGAVELRGWAVPPSYDREAKKLLWAKELHFEGEDATTLNYDVRVLGREGVLSMNAVASMSELADVQAGMQTLAALVDFNPGQRYADFDPRTDDIATYGIAALVAGGLAAKSGLLAKLGVLLASSWKLIAVGVVALAASLRKLTAGKKSPIQD